MTRRNKRIDLCTIHVTGGIGNNMTARGQHYVWRHYLESWSQESGQVYCMREGTIIQTSPINIMKQRDFYKLIPFTEEDVQCFQHWLDNICEPSMRNVNRRTFDVFAKIANANEIIQSTSGFTEEDKNIARRTVIELEETLHTGIEAGAIPIMDALRQENLRILDDDDSAIVFFRFIAHQHFRTKVMREGIGKVLSTLDPRFDFSRLRHVFCHCFADNLGGSLYVDRKRLRVVLLKDHKSRLITGDQPTVNLAAKENMDHHDVATYYPLTPNLAVMVTFNKLQRRFIEVSDEIVELLNQTMAFRADEFLVGPSESVLQETKKPSDRPVVLPLIMSAAS